MMMKRNLALIILVVSLSFIVGACDYRQATSTSVETFIATSIPTVKPIPTDKPTFTSFFITRTSTPTKPSSPTYTQFSKPTGTPSPTPTIPQATLAARATLDSIVKQHPDLMEYYSWDCTAYPCYASGIGLSPNGIWGVFFSVKVGAGLKFIQVGGTKEWEIYFPEAYGTPSGAGVVDIKHWSLDGRYVYVSPRPEADGGDFWFWRFGEKLIRLDLETGQWIDTKMGSASSFSPNDKYIAFRGNDGVHIHEFKTGDERIFAVSSVIKQYGRFVWSLDSNKITFVAAAWSADQGDEPNGSTILLIDLQNNTIVTLLEITDGLLYPIAWLESDRVELGNYSDGPSGQARYYLDLDKKYIYPINLR